jgi:hypothetical protein
MFTISADDEHSGSDTILKVLDKAFKQCRRLPDIVLKQRGLDRLNRLRYNKNI